MNEYICNRMKYNKERKHRLDINKSAFEFYAVISFLVSFYFVLMTIQAEIDMFLLLEISFNFIMPK